MLAALVQERAARRHTLARIEELIEQTPNQHVEAHDLKAAGIRHLPLSFEGDTQHYPCFFKSYQGELPLPQKEKEDRLLKFEPDPDHIMWDTRDMEVFLTHHFGGCWEDAWQKYPHSPPLSCVYREIGDYKSGQLMKCIEFHWYAVSVTEYSEGNCPHFKAILKSEAIGDGRLLRREIITITDIMATRLRTKSLRRHIMLVVSFTGPRHSRILEADFDGKFLNIRASKLYDFIQMNTILCNCWRGIGLVTRAARLGWKPPRPVMNKPNQCV
ncbi:hypothetical protein BJX63DRAFT_445194 [Aspergillus granulosus]|uniref:Uncharacterized protein n=1 Tax=Aspergillus granulosus TaxID=176169 RepID=A0ABR4H417_9EURO